MPQGDKSAYTDKQRRKAAGIEKSLEAQGRPAKDAEWIAWATVNKQDGGGKENGSGRSRSRSEAAKKGWETRRKKAAKPA